MFFKLKKDNVPQNIMTMDEKEALIGSVNACERNIETLAEQVEKYASELDKAKNELAMVEKEMSILRMGTEELKTCENNYDVPYLSKENKWRVITSICAYGGCEYRWFERDSELEALRESIMRTCRGGTVETGCTCPECYREYMNDAI